jgi:DNA-binding transcriptional MerR regulator
MSDSIVEPTPTPPPARPAAGGGTAAGRLYLTADLRAATGLSRTHMDFYLREGLVRPTARAESGLLLFDEAELATLRDVLRWRHDGIGLKQIRARLGR